MFVDTRDDVVIDPYGFVGIIGDDDHIVPFIKQLSDLQTDLIPLTKYCQKR